MARCGVNAASSRQPAMKSRQSKFVPLSAAGHSWGGLILGGRTAVSLLCAATSMANAFSCQAFLLPTFGYLWNLVHTPRLWQPTNDFEEQNNANMRNLRKRLRQNVPGDYEWQLPHIR